MKLQWGNACMALQTSNCLLHINVLALQPPAVTDTDLASVRGQLHEKQSMCNYCANKLDLHIGTLARFYLNFNSSPGPKKYFFPSRN